jgi:hypothetical protein
METFGPLCWHVEAMDGQDNTQSFGPELICELVFSPSAQFCSTYQGGHAYIIECYDQYATSGLAATSCIRSLAAVIFPLFANQMYAALG